ncbi:MAG: site-2 protease family protein [Planctomycetes bacterium]|nr:site-2 protease family protein [Planctomycetota bacterium]
MFPGPPPERPSAAPAPAEPELVEPLPEPPSTRSKPPTVAGVRARLNAPPSASRPFVTALVLVVSLALFVYFTAADVWQTTAVLVGVLFVHELGHYIGMRAFGYRDVKMFFIPFLGAAVSGRNHTAPPWQQGVVLLLGPLPGVALGCALLPVTQLDPVVAQAAFMLVLLNAFNLLPVPPLDGGRLLEVLLFNRYALLAAATRLAAAGVLFLIAFAINATPLGVLGGIMAATVPLVYRQGVGVAAFRRAHPDLPSDPADLTDEELAELIDLLNQMFKQGLSDRNATEWVRVLHGQAVTPVATAPQVFALLAAYAAGVVAAVGFFVVHFILTR